MLSYHYKSSMWNVKFHEMNENSSSLAKALYNTNKNFYDPCQGLVIVPSRSTVPNIVCYIQRAVLSLGVPVIFPKRL